MSRWKVEVGFWWVAMQADEQGREIPGTAKRFPTHAEALAYADRQARTRRYVLPRSNSTPKRADYQWHIKQVESGALLTRAKRTNDGYRMTQKLHIGRKDLVGVAMLLLAHAERIEK
ncbi:TPA: hypothetical protein JAL39_002283 [Corynebacterium striatum]|uniref:hypothetical protein n=1 Tax=Corynebacterium striatum TaxID=43770 RepID=UPI001419AA70|nr:hypothetical protein [Corynebacterium striatum]NHX52991.1 hypothetical protein [Corynebacterium striatum]NHY37603.1 hypothetical protein [Corynebacterium striatum]HAT1133949.1 hypothetical protein [Corynebacterium striatum]HAT1239918.1 hypothetical protein [Corynebacterium striatum]HAT1246610.1 hypothetical protein [Corynebacterium striatum]